MTVIALAFHSTDYVDISTAGEYESQQKMLVMTPAQCRAGRALVGLTQPALAKAASLGLSTVVDFERGRRAVSEAASSAMQSALTAAGVIFIDENGEGPGVRLRKDRL